MFYVHFNEDISNPNKHCYKMSAPSILVIKFDHHHDNRLIYESLAFYIRNKSLSSVMHANGHDCFVLLLHTFLG